jgi:adenylate kinase family enzyme
MRRINLIGTSCAGKTTFARRLSCLLSLPHTELDALHWEPNWTPAPLPVFRARVATAAADDAWIIDGNYSQARDLLWARADTIIWLDYPFPLVLRQSIRRTLSRLITRSPCCNGNRESLRVVFSRHSIILWVIQTHAQRRREFPSLLASFAATGRTAITLRSPAEARRWLATLPPPPGAPGERRCEGSARCDLHAHEPRIVESTVPPAIMKS